MLSRPLELSAMEVLYATDRVQNTDQDEGKPIAKRLLLKLGSAYLEMIGEQPKGGTITVHVTESEAWLLRSKLNSGDRCDADPKLGIHMLRKLYAILLAFDAADQAGEMPDADGGDRAFADVPAAQYVSDPDSDLGRYDDLAGVA